MDSDVFRSKTMDLVAHCEADHLSTDGNKQQLLVRLVEHHRAQGCDRRNPSSVLHNSELELLTRSEEMHRAFESGSDVQDGDGMGDSYHAFRT